MNTKKAEQHFRIARLFLEQAAFQLDSGLAEEEATTKPSQPMTRAEIHLKTAAFYSRLAEEEASLALGAVTPAPNPAATVS